MLTDLEALTLEDIEDDCYGLWEVDWGFNGRAPPTDPADRIAVVSALLRSGFIELRLAAWKHMRETEPLPLDAALPIVADYDNWRAPSEDGGLVYTLTESPAGETARRQWWAKHAKE